MRPKALPAPAVLVALKVRQNSGPGLVPGPHCRHSRESKLGGFSREPQTQKKTVPRFGDAIVSLATRRQMEITSAGGAEGSIGMDPGVANSRSAQKN